MQKINGSVTSDNTEEFLFTYSEDEKQQKEINEANAKLVFCPEFIPYRQNIKKQFGLTHVETLLYGFVRFYKANASVRFYFTNSQLADILDCSEQTISASISNLVKKELIKVSHKVGSGGGTTRFVNSVLVESRLLKNQESDSLKTSSQTTEKLVANKNRIKDNRIEVERERESETSLTLAIGNYNSIKTLTEETVTAIAQDYGVPIEFVLNVKEDLELYCGSTGKRYKDYNLTLRNWVKRDKAKKMYDIVNMSKKRGGVYDARD